MWEAIIDAWVYEAQMAHEAAMQARAVRIAWMVCAGVAILTMGLNAALAGTVEVRKRGFLATVAAFALGNMVLATLDPTAQTIYLVNGALVAGSVWFVYHENRLESLKASSTHDDSGADPEPVPPGDGPT